MYKPRPTRSLPWYRAAHFLWIVALAALAASAPRLHAQKLYFESFDSLPLGPSVEEEIRAVKVWTETGPAGWVTDDSLVPGVGTGLDGRTEWAGWSFANKDWWAATAGNQRRVEFTFGQGTVMIADPDEWDDAGHAVGLLDEYITSAPISVQGAAENSLVLTIDSSWRPEGFDDGAPSFPVDANNKAINNQTGIITMRIGNGDEVEILNFNSDKNDPNYHADNTFINEDVTIPLTIPAGATSITLKFAMVHAANDWWWALDNLAVGVPPYVRGITNDGVSFTLRFVEALGKNIDEGQPITVQLDTEENVPVTVERDENNRLWVTHNKAPTIFDPASKHTVKVKYTTSEAKVVEDSIQFTAPSYVSVKSAPTSIRAVITDAPWMITDESKGVQLEIDGKVVTATEVARDGGVVNVDYVIPEPYPSGSAHALKVKFTADTGQVLEETVNFVAVVYAVVPTDLASDLGSGSDPGMRWRTHQVPSPPGRANTISETEKQLRGELGESIHETTDQGDDGFFAIDYVNFDQNAAPAGNFKNSATEPLNTDDLHIPGIPGTTGNTDYVAAEALTYVEFPTTGLYQMVVNSDDGFQVSTGPTSNPTQVVLGLWDGGRGAADTVFYFRIDKAGVYPFRLLYFEGTSDASVEWFTVKDGASALVGGPQEGSLKAFRQRTQTSNGIQSIVKQADGKLVITYQGTLQSANVVTGPYTPVQNAASPFTVTPDTSQKFYRAQ